MERFHLLTVILVILLATSTSAQTKPGDTCKIDTDCSPTPGTTYLICDQTTFECKCQEGNFNFIDGQCEQFIGDDCPSQYGQPNTKNSVCDAATGKVVCLAPFSQSKKEKICVKQYKGTCMQDQCDGYAFLTCSSTGFCECDDKSHFSTTESACSLNAEQDCLPPPPAPEPTQTCTERSECKPDPFGGTKCKCSEGLEPNEVNQCFAFHNSYCETTSSSAPCNPGSFLLCQAGTCKCRMSDNDVVYDDLARNCTVLASRQCSENQEPCTKFAVCNGSVCRCRADAKESSSGSGKCVRRFGLSCSNPPDSAQPGCDKDQFMDCQPEGTCGCNYDSWYNPEDDKCLLKADAECTFGAQPCTPYSACEYDPQDGNYKCICDSGFSRNSQGKCVKTYGSICSLNENLCDSTQYLTCDPTSFKCACIEKQQTIYNGGSCRRRANATCSIDIGAQKCVDNSQCLYESGESRCSCMDLLTPGSAGACVIPYSGRCGYPVVGECDEEGYQQCASDVGLCVCRDPSKMMYDSKFKQCRLSLGQTCSPPEDGGLFCASGLVCGDVQRCICDKANGFVEENGACTKSANSTCIEDSVFPIDQCNSYSTCEQGRCKCRSNYVLYGSYPNARCLGALNARCNNDVDDCYTAGSLVCSTNGYCECAWPEQGYNSTDKSCYSYLNGKCNDGEIENGPSLRCNPYAYLTCDRSGFEGKCVCENGYGSLNGITCVGNAAAFAAHILLVVFFFCFVKIIA